MASRPDCFFTGIRQCARIKLSENRALGNPSKVLKFMNFPEVKRAVYRQNPLAEVVCQLRFPRIFQLDESVPADFQRALGREYPAVNSRETAAFVVGGSEASTSPVSRRVIYDFSTSDNEFTISLCSDFLAIKTTKYERWEVLVAHIENAMKALRASYEVPFFNRVGLRYVNVIDREKLGLSGRPWIELIRESAMGLLGDAGIVGDDVVEQSATTLLSLEHGHVAIRSGVHVVADNNTKHYVIDSDFFLESPIASEADAFELLSYYNSGARNAFRWFIKEALHDALEPE